ncbi:hypothetical protein BGZ95_008030 [Linnemannia exigua]|uniref:Uncharacterized protein n=1 Tax=Linnemannia exigua TaxID=604196 RepID=A0AAD4DG90_9FUNG|nr:hypothetical protein BGZ95_008030 [Linnemannia exigua]
MKLSITALILSVVSAVVLATPGSDAAAIHKRAPVTTSKSVHSGYNDWDCRPSAAHPRPVILVHATLFTKESWGVFGPKIAEQGYCVYSLTYGRYWKTLLPMIGAIAPAVDNAKEVGASQADFIGHSQGGVLPRYWVQYQGGKGKMHSMIGISAINHGTSWQGLAPMLEKLKGMVQFLTFNNDLVTKAAPALQDIMSTSQFVKDLNAHGETLPDVFQANIVTKYDEIVSPYKSSFQSGEGVVNVVLQDLCGSAYVEHALMVTSKTTLRWVLNQLDPSTASPANCNPQF